MLKRLFLASTTLLCLTLIGNSPGIAKIKNLQASQLLAHELQNGKMTSDGMEHDHQTIKIPADQPIPTVNIVIR